MNRADRDWISLGLILALLLLVTVNPVIAELPAGPDAYTAKQYVADRVVFYRKIILQAYQEGGRKNPAWDEAAERFLKVGSRHFAMVPDDLRLDQLLAIAKPAIDAGCDDPRVLYIYGRILHQLGDGTQAAVFYNRAYQRRVDTPLNPMMNALLTRRVVDAASPQVAAKGQQENPATEAFAKALAYPGWQGIELRIVFDESRDYLDNAPIDDLLCLSNTLDAAKDANPWLVKMVGGIYHDRAGWLARTGAWGKDVTPGQWAGFADHMGKAKVLLGDAWKLQPKFPEAATAMILVAKAQFADEGQTPRFWFDRALKGQVDWYPAYSMMLGALWPRWGGSHKAMFDLGLECMATSRYDTQVPWVMIEAMIGVSRDMEGKKDYWKEPGVYEQTSKLFNAYEADSAHCINFDYVRSCRATVAWFCGRPDEAYDILKALGNNVNPRAMTYLETDLETLEQHVIIEAKPFAKALSHATAERNAGRPDQAMEGLQAAHDKAQNDAIALHVIDALIAQTQVERDFRQGQWVNLTFANNSPLWKSVGGDWTVEGPQAIVGKSDENGMVLRSMLMLGSNYEIEGNVEYLQSPFSFFNAGVITNFSVASPLAWVGTVLIKGENKVALAKPGLAVKDMACFTTPVQNINKLRLVVHDDVLAVWVNDQPVIQDLKPSGYVNGPDCGLALGGSYWYSGASVRFSNFRIRYTGPVAGISPATQPASQPTPAH